MTSLRRWARTLRAHLRYRSSEAPMSDIFDTFGPVTLVLDGATWDFTCAQCPWGTPWLLEAGFDGYLGLENYDLAQSLAQEHAAEHDAVTS